MLLLLLACSSGASSASGASGASTRGIGLSGGGITGLLAAQCQLEHLHQGNFKFSVPSSTITTATASGGTLGYLVYHSTTAHSTASDGSTGIKPVTYPPSLNFSMAYADAKSNVVPAGTTWWANAINYLRNFSSSNSFSDVNTAMMDPADVAAPADDCKSWWVDLMETLFGLGYGVAPSEMRTSPSGDALITFAALEAKGCPIKRNQSSGVMQTAPEYLHTALVHSTEGGATLTAELGNGLTLLPSSSASGLSLLAASAWSTAFYSASIVESSVQYAAEQLAELAGKGLLMTGTASIGTGSTQQKAKVHLIDGGFVDTTGIVALLQRQTSKILVFYNNNDALAPAGPSGQEVATFAYLFGEDVPTDTMNTLGGPRFTKLFPNELYSSVIANLTNSSRLFASLKNVPVQVNTWLGIEKPYVLEELLILSNSPAAGFLDSFADPDIKANLSPLWPNRIPITMSSLDANLLCWYERFKLDRHADAITSFFQG